MRPGWLASILSRIRGLFGRVRADREFSEEIEAHVEMLTERLVCRGMSQTEAAVTARRQFGNSTLLKQRHREARMFLWLATVRQDILLYDPFGTSRTATCDHRGSGIVSRDRSQCGCIYATECVVFQSTDAKRPLQFCTGLSPVRRLVHRSRTYSSFTTEDYDAVRAHATTLEDAAAWDEVRHS